MANIQNELNNIKNAIYGKDVRNSIHDAIKTCYDDASVNNDNANMEVKLARGTHNTLNDRLCEVDEKQNSLSSQLAHKANKGGSIAISQIDKNLGKLDQTYLTDELLQQITGNTSVNTVPHDNSITLEKLAFSTLTGVPINLANPKEFDRDKHLVNGSMYAVEGSYINTRFVTGFIPVMKGKRYFSSPYYKIALYDEEKNYLKDIENNSVINVNGFVRICGEIEYISEFMFNEGTELCEYIHYFEGTLKPSSIKNGSIDKNKLSFPTLNIDISYNLLNIKNTLFNKYIKPNGDLTVCVDNFVNKLYVTDYIEVKSESNYIINGKTYNVYGYDNNFNPIKSINIIDNANGVMFVCPSDVTYIRATLYEEDKATAMIYEGESVKPFVPYGEGILPKGIVKSENIEDGAVFKPSIISPNLFNKNTVKKGYFVQGWNGSVTPPIDGSTGWNASDWIEIEEGETYSFTIMNQMAYYDKNKTYLKIETNGGNVQVAPEGAKYLRISVKDDILDTFQIVKGENLGEYTEYGTRFISKEQIHPSVFTGEKDFRYCVPNVIEVVEGETTEIFFDSILGVHNIEDYYISLSGFKKIEDSNQRKMVITNPTINDSSNGKILVYNNFNKLITTIPLKIKVNPVTNPSTPKNILVIGDSLTGQNSTTITELYRKFIDYNLTNLKLIGTKNWGEGKNHEGRGGWKINDYLINKTDNPFWSDTLGKSSFKEYCNKNGYSGIDYCIIHMNWNDSIENPTHMYNQYKNIMTRISEDYPNCKIIAVSLSSYAKYSSQSNKWKQCTKFNAFDLADEYTKLSDENPNWYYINMLSQFDVEYSNVYTTTSVNIRSSEVEKKLVDHVHCATAGYLQIADAYFRKLMELVNN